MLRLKNKATDKNGAVTELKLRTPFGGHRPIEYTDYAPFVSLKPELDGYIEKLFAGDNSMDEGSKDVLDNLIYDSAAKAEQDLNRQKINHMDNIHSLRDRRVGDKLAFERQLEQLKTALEENDQELEEIKARYDVNKF